MNILINRGNVQTAKSYPYWDAVVSMLGSHDLSEIKGILPLDQVVGYVNWCDVWVSIDSFLPHLVEFHGLKPGVVLWGKSDPSIFGYPRNVNLLKDRSRLRPDQFRWWNDVIPSKEDFYEPALVVEAILSFDRVTPT